MVPKSLKKISPLLRKALFSAAEARRLGIHPSLLAYYCRKGVLERVSRGFYRLANSNLYPPHEWQDVALIARSIPKGVLCLLTALAYYELTDEFAREVWIAVPRESRPPKRSNTKVVRLSNMTLGVTQIQLGRINVRMFDRERTIVDSFRYLSKDTAIKGLKRYLKRTGRDKPDIQKLTKYAKLLRTDIGSYVEAVIT